MNLATIEDPASRREVEIRIVGGATLVGAIELVSPGNKDRAEAHRAFAAKCASYLHEGIGLVIIDVVTSTRQPAR